MSIGQAKQGQLDLAWANSFLSELPASAQEALMESSHEEEIARGQNVYRELPQPRFVFLALIVSGLLRNYVTSPRGRRIVTRYWRASEVIGLTSMLAHGAPSGVEVVRGGSMLRLDPVVLERLAKTDPAVSWAIAGELSKRVLASVAMQVPNTFGSVRVRVAWHLLEQIFEIDGREVVQVRQQELADCVASVREVVARELGTLQQSGIISRDGDLIVIDDRERLAKIAREIDG